MTKTYLVKTNNTATNYSLKLINDDGQITMVPITEWCPFNPTGLKLPENPSNRKWWDIKKIESKGITEIELTYKPTRTLGPTGERKSTSRKPWHEYLTDEDIGTYAELKILGEQRKIDAEKPRKMTEVEKLQAKIARDQAKLNELMIMTNQHKK